MTAARVPLPHWHTESRPCRHPTPTPAVHSPAYLAASARFPNKRLIAVGKFERNVKDHLSMFLKLRFHVLRCSGNDTFLRPFVNTLSVFGLHQAAQCQRLYSTPATDAPVLVADRSGRPSSPSSPPRPLTPTDRGPRRRGAGPSSYCLWQRFLLQRPCERRKNSKLFTNARKNVSFLFDRGTPNPSLEDMERWCFTLRSNFPTAMSRLFGNRAKTAK